MKDWPIIFSAPMVRALIDGRKTMTRRLRYVKHGPGQRESQWCRVRPGDRLWVRETGKSYFKRALNSAGWIYRADCHEFTGDRLIHQIGANEIKWTSPIRMPRWASRLTLTVTAVRQERLQEITRADALAEGCRYQKCDHPDCLPLGHDAPRGAFYQVWRDLHGHESWAANPEVVALTFTVAKHNIDAKAAA